MNVITADDFSGVIENHPFAKYFTILGYKDGSTSSVPHQFGRNWLDEPGEGTLHIGKVSGLGVGSMVKFDTVQKLIVGNHVAGGARLRFILSSLHQTNTLSISMMSHAYGITDPQRPSMGDTELKNDIWIGDEAMFLGGVTVENGCVIGARSLVPPGFKSEPYGVYVGSPARLVRFRFSEKVIEKLLALAWWEMPLTWIKEHNQFFLEDLTVDEGKSLDLLNALIEAKNRATK